MGHVSERGLLELYKQGLLGKSKLNPLEQCDHCILGKATRVKFSNVVHSTKNKLDYIHMDLWGPTPVESNGGAKYFLSIVDDFSTKVWIFLLKNKSDTYSRFKEWLKQIQTQTERKVKTIRTDNGLEFLSHEFKNLCKDQGITRHRTVRFTPQQNGLAKRMNRTIMESEMYVVFITVA